MQSHYTIIGMFKAAESKKEADQQEPLDDLDHEREEDEEAETTDAEEEGTVTEDEQETTEPQEPEAQYDEETQALIDEANGARERFQETVKAVDELQSEIRQLEEKLDRDYGPQEEFASLDGECFEYTDLEYI